MSEQIIRIITELGYLGTFLLMLLESVFAPIPTELIIPFAGFSAARGDLNFLGVILAASAGAMVGMIPWYLAGRLFGLERVKRLSNRFGRWFALNSDEITSATAWFNRFGPAIVFFGRLLPIIRTLISVPAGLARMPAVLFVAASGAGALLWNCLLVGAGYLLNEHYDQVEVLLDPLTIVVLVGVVVVYLWRVVVWTPGRQA